MNALNVEHRQHLTGAHVEHEAGRRQGTELCACCGEFLMQNMLNAQIDSKLDRALQAIGCKTRHVQSG